jgi:hypothetical protein
MGFLIIEENIKESSTSEIKKIEGLKRKNKKKYLVTINYYKINKRIKYKMV